LYHAALVPGLTSFAKPGSLNNTLNITGVKVPILGSRLILNLREAYYRPFEDEFERSEVHKPIQFADSESDCQTRLGSGRDDFEMSVVDSSSVKVYLMPGETVVTDSDGTAAGELGDVLHRRG